MLWRVTGSIRSQSQTWLTDWITTANNFNILRFLMLIILIYGKESACNGGELGLILGLGWEIPLEKGISTYSNILVWRIPWTEGTEELDRLQSMESQRVKHDWVTNTFFFSDLFIINISTLEGVICALKKNVYFGSVGCNVLHISVRTFWSKIWSRSDISLLIFHLNVLSIAESGKDCFLIQGLKLQLR